MNIKRIAISALLAGFSVAAMAADPSSGASTGSNSNSAPNVQEMSFKDLDADGDGKITKQEASLLAGKFSEVDRNHDGIIDQAEFSQYKTQLKSGMGGTTFNNPEGAGSRGMPSSGGVGNGDDGSDPGRTGKGSDMR